MSYTIQQSISDQLRKENEERNEDRSEQTSWWPSSLGSCLTGAWLQRNGGEREPFDDRTLRVFKVGNIFEKFVVDTVTKQDVEFEEQVRLEWPEQNVTGYADLVVTKPEHLLYEIKSKQSRGFWYMEKSGQPGRHNAYQTWIGAKILDIDEARLIYVSKDDLAIMEFVIRKDDKELEAEVMQQLDLLNEAQKTGVAPPPAPKGSWQAKYCGHHAECVKQEAYIKSDYQYVK